MRVTSRALGRFILIPPRQQTVCPACDEKHTIRWVQEEHLRLFERGIFHGLKLALRIAREEAWKTDPEVLGDYIKARIRRAIKRRKGGK